MNRQKDDAHGFFVSCRPWWQRQVHHGLLLSRRTMIILMKRNATQEQIDQVTEWITSVGYHPHLSQGVERTLIGAIGDDRGKIRLKSAAFLPGVEQIVPILKPYQLASPELQETAHVGR